MRKRRVREKRAVGKKEKIQGKASIKKRKICQGLADSRNKGKRKAKRNRNGQK